MFRAVGRYLLEEAKPRALRIMKGTELWFGIVIGAVVVWRGDHTVLQTMKVGDLSGIYLTYASIALGFSLTGLTLVLTLPDREFVAKLSALKLSDGTNYYTDLLFVFSWTAILHWVGIIGVLVLLAILGVGEIVLPLGAPLWQRIVVGTVIAVGIYAFGQFLLTIITLSQVGRVYSRSPK